MSNKSEKDKTMSNKSEKDKTFKQECEDLIRKANASEWAILKAEEFREKFELSNAAIAVFVSLFDEMKTDYESMSFGDRIFNKKIDSKKHIELSKTYFKQLSEIDLLFKKKEDDYRKKLLDECKSSTTEE